MFWFHQLRTQNQNRKIEQKLWMASGNAGYNFGSCPDFLILQLFILAHTIYPSNRRNFSKSMGGGGQRAKSAQGTIKILMVRISLQIWPFFLPTLGAQYLHHWGGLCPTGGGGGWGTPKEIWNHAPGLANTLYAWQRFLETLCICDWNRRNMLILMCWIYTRKTMKTLRRYVSWFKI